MIKLKLWWVLYNNKISDTQSIELADREMMINLLEENHLEVIAIEEYSKHGDIITPDEWKKQYYNSNN